MAVSTLGLATDRGQRVLRYLWAVGRAILTGPPRLDPWYGPASVEQLRRIDQLCDDRVLVSPAWQPLNERQAETIIAQLLNGTYNPQAWE